jgi:hypothetical protein
LRGLHQSGLDEFGEPKAEKYVWAATLDLINCLETGGFGVVKRTNRRRAKIRMGALVTKKLDRDFRVCRKIGLGVPEKYKWEWTVGTLLWAEMNGEVTPYKTHNGRLAWKASEEGQRGTAKLADVHQSSQPPNVRPLACPNGARNDATEAGRDGEHRG